MSMATFTDPTRIPVLVADSLISGPDNASALTTPDHPHGISNIFPPGSGFVPTRLVRKTCIVNSGLAMAMVGGVVPMCVFREDALAHFRNQPECSGMDVELFLQQYEADPDGSIVPEEHRRASAEQPTDWRGTAPVSSPYGGTQQAGRGRSEEQDSRARAGDGFGDGRDEDRGRCCRQLRLWGRGL